MSLISNRSYTKSKLLETVGFVSRKEEKCIDLVGNNIIVKDTMAYNPNSPSAPRTALKWAQGYTSRFIIPTPYERPNDPLSIKIVDIDARSEGGRAYKVIDSENRRFDLREDQILEVIANCGIKAGGDIEGKFVWGILGSQIKLVLVGSKLHSEMLKRHE